MPSPRTLLLPLVAAAALPLAACDLAVETGDRTVQSRSVAGFEAIRASDGVDVELRRGDTPRVRVRAGDKVIDDVHTTVADGELRIGYDGPDLVLADDLVVEVTAPALTAIEADGGSDVDARGLDGAALTVIADGGADVRIAGRVDRLELAADGGADADLSDLAAGAVRLDADGGADAEVHAIDTLDATVDGGADVSYRGDPDVTRHVDESGDFGRS